MIRYFTRKDGTRTLQELNYDSEWVDVPEITEEQERQQLAIEAELREIEHEKIRQRLKGLSYTVRK